MADLTPELLERLEAIAGAATLAPSDRTYSTYAEHIAAASPDVVLALVADARKLARIRALLVVDGPRWLLATIKEVLDGGT